MFFFFLVPIYNLLMLAPFLVSHGPNLSFWKTWTKFWDTPINWKQRNA